MRVVYKLFSGLHGLLTKCKNKDFHPISINMTNESFSGAGTVLSMSIQNIDMLTDNTQPYELVQILSEETNNVTKLIKKYHGTIVQQIGGQVLAYWKDLDSTSASIKTELAFSAALSIMKMYSPSINIRIVLVSENIFADFFGPKRQFQMRGPAVALTEQLMIISKDNFTNQRHLLLLSAQTVSRLKVDASQMRLIRHIQNGREFFELDMAS